MSLVIARSIAASDLVTRCAALAASSPSSRILTSVISIASASETSRTLAPRLCWNSTSPCAASSCSEARRMNRDVPNRSHRSTSTRRWRGANSPARIAARSASVTAGFASSGTAELPLVLGP